jgi:hypothetical protein
LSIMLIERFSSSGHELVPTFWFGSRIRECLLVSAAPVERMHWRLYAQPRARV